MLKTNYIYSKLSFYKLLQFLKLYISLKKIETLIMIYLHNFQKQLGKLKYKYKNICKNRFINRHT